MVLVRESKVQRCSLGADILPFPYPTRPSKQMKRFLNFIDVTLSLFIVSPLVVSFWCGTWNYMDHELKFITNWQKFLIGNVAHVMFAILREALHDEFAIPKMGDTRLRKIRRFFVTRIYTYAFGIACIAQWNGGWGVMDEYFGSDVRVLAINCALCIPLASLKGLRNLLAPPMVLITDKKEFTFTFPTRFRTEVSTCVVFSIELLCDEMTRNTKYLVH